jgi:hypothetical protein
LFPSVQAERDDDARVGDARRFVTEIENMVVRARHGGPQPRVDRIAGPDRTGSAFAVVDAVGRFVDIDLDPGWWAALGSARVAAGLLEALATARLKAALVPMILRRDDYQALHRHDADDSFLDAARGRITEADRLIDSADRVPRERVAVRVVAGPLGLFRVHARGGRIERAEVTAVLARGDTDRLLADARLALAKVESGGGT